MYASNKVAIGLYEAGGICDGGSERLARILDGAEDDILIMGFVAGRVVTVASTPWAGI